MAFFGITQLGYQDTIREHVNSPDYTPQYVFRSGIYRDPGGVRLPPLEDQNRFASSAASGRTPVATGLAKEEGGRDGSSASSLGHRGSHLELSRLKGRHLVPTEEPISIYRRPVVTSSDIALWRKDEPLREREPWTRVKRHVHVNSEMTRFTDQMALTNRDFSLF